MVLGLGGQREYVQLEVELGQGGGDAPSTSAPKLQPTAGWDVPSESPRRRQQRERTTLIVLGSVLAVIIIGAVVTGLSTDEPGLPVVYGPTASPAAVEAGDSSGLADDGAVGASPAAPLPPPPSASGATGDRDYGLGGDAAAYRGGDGSVDPTYRNCSGPHLRCRVVHPLPVPGEDFRGLPRHAHSRRGMVAADNSRCSEIGRDVLTDGGRAADAAVATALCLGVVNPISSGIGGGAFIVVRLANGSGEFINARETAPAAANATMYEGKSPFASLDGGLAVAVPMELRGLHALWHRHGRMPWRRLVQPAAALARAGFAAHPYLLYTLSGPFNQERVRNRTALREAFMVPTEDGGWRLPYVGELCCQRPLLADTLDSIARKGAHWLYAPEQAEKLAAEIQAAGGIITANDLTSATAVIEPLLTAQIGKDTLHFPPPPSSAAVVAFALKFLAGYEDGGFTSSAPELSTHRLVEAMKHGFAARTALGDPGFPPTEAAANVSEVVASLLSDTFVEQMRSATSDTHVLPADEYGGVWNPLAAGVAAPPDDHGTSHFCVVDADLTAVSITTTVNTVLGSGVVSPSLGIVLNNQMDDFSQPGRINSTITPHPSPANFIAPGKRPLSAMSPSVVTGPDGALRAVAGASGGPLIVSATLQTLARLLLQGLGVEEAVMGARVHDQLLPRNAAFHESYEWGDVAWHVANATLAYLAQVGDALIPDSTSLGISQAIFLEDGVMHGMSDARKDGASLGV